MKETLIFELNPYKNDSIIVGINNTWRDRISSVKENQLHELNSYTNDSHVFDSADKYENWK